VTVPVTRFPDVRIETERLVLRGFGTGDAVRLGEVLAGGDTDALSPGAPDEVGGLPGWLAEGVHEHRLRGGGIHLAIEDKSSGEHVGAISLFTTDWDARATEVGYGIRNRHRGNGYATEAVVALTGWALTDGGMQRVQLRANTDNKPSVRVAEKAGYRYEGVLRRASMENDGLHDLSVFSMLDDDPPSYENCAPPE
jgi:RimJ/RimL family protein N-acetyltransferase